MSVGLAELKRGPVNGDWVEDAFEPEFDDGTVTVTEFDDDGIERTKVFDKSASHVRVTNEDFNDIERSERDINLNLEIKMDNLNTVATEASEELSQYVDSLDLDTENKDKIKLQAELEKVREIATNKILHTAANNNLSQADVARLNEFNMYFEWAEQPDGKFVPAYKTTVGNMLTERALQYGEKLKDRQGDHEQVVDALDSLTELVDSFSDPAEKLDMGFTITQIWRNLANSACFSIFDLIIAKSLKEQFEPADTLNPGYEFAVNWYKRLLLQSFAFSGPVFVYLATTDNKEIKVAAEMAMKQAVKSFETYHAKKLLKVEAVRMNCPGGPDQIGIAQEIMFASGVVEAKKLEAVDLDF